MGARSASLHCGNSTLVLLSKPQLRNRRQALKGKWEIHKRVENRMVVYPLVRPPRAAARSRRPQTAKSPPGNGESLSQFEYPGYPVPGKKSLPDRA